MPKKPTGRRRKGAPPPAAAPPEAAAAPAVTSPKPASAAPAKRGRPSAYTKKLGDLICERLAAGETLRAICRDPGMPDERAVRAWAMDPSHPISPQYDRARAIGYHSMGDEIVEISDDATNDYVQKRKDNGETFLVFDREHVKRSELRINTRKWILARMLPKTYGDKIEVGGDPDKPIVVNHAADELVSRIARIAARAGAGKAPQ